jgi:WD40 repeat protein/serine/threonine protein kinase
MGETVSSSSWQAGDVIDDRYQVTRLAGSGGMGLVYQVRHLQWDVDLAAKRLHSDALRSSARRRQFVGEAEAWVSLGLHPNICGCHYVRQLDGLPTVFAEYVGGGSLQDWIADGQFYRGSADAVALRVLDVAIQFAWGLDHAHQRGLVHQDVKPANVLIDPSDDDIIVKVTDFGLARARAGAPVTVTGSVDGAPATSSVVVSRAGLTPAYASPEQAAGKKLSRRTDVYSYAVSVLEMFTGGPIWETGVAAGRALAAYLAGGPVRPGPPAMPAAVAGLLERCLHHDPARRPGSMAEIAAELADIYGQRSDGSYFRALPRSAELLADDLANRGASLLDLDRTADAEETFAAALRADPRHVTAVYNAGLLRWRSGVVTDEGLLAEIETRHGDLEAPWEARHLAALVHLERGDLDSAGSLLRDLAAERPDDRDVRHTARTLESGQAVDARCLGTQPIPWHNDPPETHQRLHGIRISRNWRRALTGSSDHTVRLWDVHSGQQLRGLVGHTDRVESVDISADGRYAVSTGWDRTVRFWDLATGDQLGVASITPWRDGKGPTQGGSRWGAWKNEFNRIVGRDYWHTSGHGPGPDSLPLNVAASPVRLNADGSVAAWAEQDGRVQVWDVRAARRLLTLDGYEDLDLVELSPDGQRLLSIDSGRDHAVLALWDLTTGKCLWRHGDYPGGAASMWLRPDGELAAVLGGDQVIRVWHLGDRRCVRTLRLPADFHPISAALSADARFLLFGGNDGAVTWWSLESGRCVRTFRGHEAEVSMVALSPDNRHAFSAGLDDAARLWRLPGEFAAPTQLSRPRRYGELTRTEARLRTLVTAAGQATADGQVEAALDLLSQARELPGCERAPQVLAAWRALGDRAARTGLRGAWPAKILKGRIGDVYQGLISGKRTVDLGRSPWAGAMFKGSGRSVALTPDARLGVYSDADGRIQIWDLIEGMRVHCIESGFGLVDEVRLTSGGRRIVCRGEADKIKTFSVETGKCVKTLRVRDAHPAALSEDARFALVTDTVDGEDGHACAEISLWDLAGGHPVRAFPGPKGRVISWWLDADGRKAVSADYDNLLRLWDLDAGQCVLTVEPETEGIRCACLTPDGRFIVAIAAGTWDLLPREELSPDPERLLNRIRMWDAVTGECVRTFDPQPMGVTEIRFSADGRWLLSAGMSRAIRIWDVTTGRCLLALPDHVNGVASLALTPDANFVLAADRDDTLRLWELDWDLKPRQ